MRITSAAKNAIKSIIVIVVTFGVFLLMRRLAGDVGGMPQVFRDAFEPSVFIRSRTFTPAIVSLMSLILLHLLVNFLILRDHMRLPPTIRGAAYGFLFGGLWFLGFLELVVIYDSGLERHVLSGIRDLVTLTTFGIVAGLLFGGGVRHDDVRLVAQDGVRAVVTIAVTFSAFHWAQYSLTLDLIEQSVDDGYALGHFTETLTDGRQAVWHGGQGYGWMSHLHFVPETGEGIIILSNSQRAWPLFGALLRDWSDGLGVAPVGMTRVLWAETAARMAIAGLVAVSLVAGWVASRRRHRPPAIRAPAGGLAAVLILWPTWAAAQDYLFLFSILPGLWPWLGAASGLAGLAMAALAMIQERAR